MDYLDQIAGQWRDRAQDLAFWVMAQMVNRTDVWGRYLRDGRAITAPFREERGKVSLTESSLAKHFRGGAGDAVLGLHSTSPDFTSRWLAIDIDRHDETDLSVTAEGNFVTAHGWWEKLRQMGLDGLLIDSNGIGGYHVLVVFEEPQGSESVHAFGEELTADFGRRGLDKRPELFPEEPHYGQHYGNWLRLPGRHHTRKHFSRIWNPEPWAEEKWLAGHDAIDQIVGLRLVSTYVAAQRGVERSRRTVCLDFDGVIHSYSSGWCGETQIPDPPIHGAREAIAHLRSKYRVVIHSARSCTEEGRRAMEAWLKKYQIEVDEICAHKPPAICYVDDRAVRFEGNWEETVAAIASFRR